MKSMNFISPASDESLLSEIGERLARMRIEAGGTQGGLAEKAGVGKRTVERMEAGGSVQLVSLLRVMRVLGLVERLDSVLPEPGDSPMALLKARGKVRRRAFRKLPADHSIWKWEEPA